MMAVQAQHLDELPMQQHHQHQHQHARTVFSGPQSDLTCCYAACSRKRGRGRDHEESSVVFDDMNNRNNLPSQFRYEQPSARVVDSTGTASTSAPPALSPLSYHLYSRVHQHNIEVDTIIRLQNERLRLELEESRKRQCRALIISVLEEKVVKRLKEKETELEMANRKNAELEEKLRQMSSENQMWFHVAKDSEAIVSSLKSSLEQVLLQNALNVAAADGKEEGYGDSEEEEGGAKPCCLQVDGAVGEARKCSVCSRNDVGVLLLPCRHLCVCKGCESKVDTCPVCNGSKNACLQIFMS